MHIVLGMKNIRNETDCYEKIKNMCSRMNPEIIKRNKNICKRDKNTYFLCMKNPKRLRFKIMFKRKKRDLFQIHINRTELLIKLFGKTFIKKSF